MSWLALLLSGAIEHIQEHQTKAKLTHNSDIYTKVYFPSLGAWETDAVTEC